MLCDPMTGCIGVTTAPIIERTIVIGDPERVIALGVTQQDESARHLGNELRHRHE